jgi:hypothetical protein
MAFYQVRDVMRKSCRDHEEVAQFYEDMQDMVDDNEKLVFMLSSMKNYEDEIVHCIKEYLKVKNSPVLNSWFQYLPDTPVVSDSLNCEDEVSEKEVIHIFGEVNHSFKITYEKLSEVSQSDSVQELFDEMKKLTNHEGVRKSWLNIMQDDM